MVDFTPLIAFGEHMPATYRFSSFVYEVVHHIDSADKPTSSNA